MKKINLLIVSILCCIAVGAVEVNNLRTEMLTNPEGIDAAHPLLSWVIGSSDRNVVQSAYQIIVASSPEKLNADEGDLWNSGKVGSDQSAKVAYNGIALNSRTHCYWKVKVWTNKGDSKWSQSSRWSMGLLNKVDWKGKWIGLDKAFPWDSLTIHSRLSARYFRKDFTSANKKQIKQATVYIAGLGMYELYINGHKIGNQVLSPSPTDYDKNVKFNTFDVTSEIRQGNNAIGTILGNGRYFNMRQNYKPQKIKTFGFPKMLFQLEIEYADGSRSIVTSDESWKVTSDGPIRSNNEWDGEEYDACKELTGWSLPHFNDKKWLRVEVVSAPEGSLSAQMNENMIVHESIKPISINKLSDGSYILDMGQNMVGWLKLNAQGKRGDKITLRFGETLKSDGTLFRDNLRNAWATNVYTMKGGVPETWEPSFVYQGFRYVEISGYPGTPTINDFEGEVIYDGMKTIGSFASSDSLLNKIYHNAYWGIRGNYKGMPVDCPQRDERQPWLGDRSTGCLGESFLFDNEKLYAKWMDDMRESQKENGQLPDMSPAFYKIYYSDNMTWPGTYLMVGDMLYNQFGNSEVIIKHYPYMKKWLSYMKSNYMQDYILTKDKYGDWCVPPESKTLIHSQDPARQTSGELISTAYYYHFLQLMCKFAKLSGNDADIEEYTALASHIKEAFNKKFYNEQARQYGNNTVTSNLLPLAFGMVDEKNDDAVFHQMLDRITLKDKLHLSTGLIGTQWLLRELTKRGRADVAFTIATQKDYPSWGYMVGKGATTIWELWNGDTASPKMNSHNHVMLLGDLLTWMYEDLAGIKSHPSYPGFKYLWMNPHPSETLTSATASTETSYGTVKSAWKLENGIFTWHVSIPANTRANVLIPAASVDEITESGKPVMTVEGLKFVRIEDYRVNLEIGSGDYTFVCNYSDAQNRWKAGIIVDEFINKHAPYPECHASTIAETTDGHLVASWFGGTKERNPDVCIWVSRLENGKWTKGQNVANGIINDTLRYACWNPVLYQVPGGELQLYYKVGPDVSGWKGKMLTSGDGGITWSQPKDLPEGFLGPIKNKPVLLKNGTLIAPSSTETKGWKVHFETTKNFGKTWKYIGPINDGKSDDGIQPSVLIHQNGDLQILCRTKDRAIGESWSKDKGKTWSPLQKTTLPNNNSGTDAVTLKDGRFLLVYNHVLPPDSAKGGKGERSPLNVAVSQDGKTWYAAAVLEDSPIGQYSYPSVIQSSDGKVHIVYTWRRKAIKHVEIDLSKLLFSKIEDGKWPSSTDKEEINAVNLNRYKVSVCDWMMLKRQKVGAITLAQEIGTDGVEVDMGSLGQRVDFLNNLNDKKTQEQFIAECNRLGMQISSIAMSAFYGQSFATRENYLALTEECIGVMKALKVKVAFLPLTNIPDLTKTPELYSTVLERLKEVAKKAEAAGVVIGIETSLPAKEEAKLIDQVASPSIRSYVNFSNILKRKDDVCKELKTLGKNRIVQIHITNTDGFWLENDPQVKMSKIKGTLDKMGWSGWLVIERSRDTKDVHNVKWNYSANAHYLKKMFQASPNASIREKM
jgi:alpha-L-rhamnosidase